MGNMETRSGGRQEPHSVPACFRFCMTSDSVKELCFPFHLSLCHKFLSISLCNSLLWNMAIGVAIIGSGEYLSFFTVGQHDSIADLADVVDRQFCQRAAFGMSNIALSRDMTNLMYDKACCQIYHRSAAQGHLLPVLEVGPDFVERDTRC